MLVFRTVVALIGIVATAAFADAQGSGRIPRIGLLSVGSDPARPLAPQWVEFVEALRGLGYVEGRNIAFERRFAAGRSELLPQFAIELAKSNVDVIVGTGLRENQAARHATTTIPIVMIVVDDPVGAGLVKSLARPGTNVTGLTFSAPGLGQKYVELLKQAAPSVNRMAIIASRPQPQELLRGMQDAARILNVTLVVPTLVRGRGDFEPVIAGAKRDGVGGLIFPNDGLTVLHRDLTVGLAIKHRLPAIYAQREHADEGALMTYGASFTERFRRAAVFVDKILKGAKPADLPVEQPTSFELVLNAKTAKAIGLTFPQELRGRAERVVER